MLTFEQILYSMLLPGTIALLMSILSRPWKSGTQPSIFTGVGLCVATFIAVIGLKGQWPGFYPGKAHEWMMWIAAASVLLVVAEKLIKNRFALIALILLICIGASVALGLGRITNPRGWSSQQSIYWIVFTVFTMLFTTGSFSLVNKRSSPVVLPLFLTALIGASVPIIGLAGSAKSIGDHLTVLASFSGGLLLASLLFKQIKIPTSTYAILSILWIGLVLCSWDAWYASLPLLDGILLIAAPLAIWTTFIATPNNRMAKPILPVLVGLLMVLPALIHAVEKFLQMREDGMI